MNLTTYPSKMFALSLVVIASLVGLTLAFTFITASSATNGPQGWRQSNTDGFGDPANSALSLGVFNQQLYAGTWHTSVAQVWRTSDGQTWNQFATTWPVSTTTAIDMEPFGSNLYVGTDSSSGAQIWRTDGSIWELVVSNGFTSTNNIIVNALVVFSNTLYAATNNAATGLEIWRSSTGNSGDWTLVHNAGSDVPGDFGFTTMDVYEGNLYLGISRNNIAELWRTNNGTTWLPVFTNGLGNPNNSMVSAMADFNGAFYIALRNTEDGGQVWRSPNGTDWTNVLTGGLGNTDNSRPYGLIVFDSHLYLVFANTSTGAEVWRTTGGSTWEQIASGGWGDDNNGYADYLDKGAEVFGSSLYIGTGNFVELKSPSA
jgi:hypothetical protein